METLKKFVSLKIALIIVVAIILSFFNLPGETQKKILPFIPDSITKNHLTLGLDLQGGSQLDYKIDLRKVPEKDQQGIIDGVRAVIEKRVNGLGVAEPNIYVSDIAGEKHIVVELAENTGLTQEDVSTYLGKDKVLEKLTDDQKKEVMLEKAKATVGKTIQLEFKEEKSGLDPQEKDRIKENALSALNKIKKGQDFAIIGQEEQQAYPGKVKFEKVDYTFASKLPEGKIKDAVTNLKSGEFSKSLIESSGSFIIDESGQPVQDTGLVIVRLIDSKEGVKDGKEVDVSHILISYKDAEGAAPSVTRTKDEAYALAKEIKAKADKGEDFAVLAQQSSDDASNKDQGGHITKPVTGDGSYVYDFEQAALGFTKEGEISAIVKTQFGYHIIKANKVTTNAKEQQYKYETLTYSTLPDPWQETGLTGKQFIRADVQLDNFYQPYVTIQFNPEGAKLFEDITGRNIGKRVAIFVGGNLISAPKVNDKITGGNAQITGQFTSEEAKTLARDLNTGAIPAPIILAGEYSIGASIGQEALQMSLYAGLIGLILIVILMLAFYRTAGLIASVALILYTTIMLFLFKANMHLGIALGISLVIFGFIVYKIINSEEPGWAELISFILSCIGFFFFTYLLSTSIVLSLAGTIGIIVSIGMAVDANVLIFERMKEELREGKTYKAALDAGFLRAWSAIKDSNFSTLITCGLLFYFGSSMIKGFAFTLSAGILISMFTAITITRTLMMGFINKKITQNPKLMMGLSDNHEPFKFKIVEKTRLWLAIAGSMVVIAIAALGIFGLNLGLDFTGGSLMEFKFSKTVERQDLVNTLTKIGEEVNAEQSSAPVAKTEPTPVKTDAGEQTLSAPATSTTKFEINPNQVIEVGTAKNNYIVKSKYIDSETHDRITAKMKDRLPEFNETRFTAIGSSVGQSFLSKAGTAVIIAILMMIIYIAFAFRKVPKEVSPWKFGACAIIALLHDVLFVTGIIVILGRFLDVEIDSLFITAMLTVLGYSVNDTIVIFDRLREKLIAKSKDESMDSIVNKSLNETMLRSLNTTLSTLLPLFAVLVFGSPSIFYFVLALTAGILTGAYSSVFIASPLLALWVKKGGK